MDQCWSNYWIVVDPNGDIVEHSLSADADDAWDAVADQQANPGITRSTLERLGYKVRHVVIVAPDAY